MVHAAARFLGIVLFCRGAGAAGGASRGLVGAQGDRGAVLGRPHVVYGLYAGR